LAGENMKRFTFIQLFLMKSVLNELVTLRAWVTHRLPLWILQLLDFLDCAVKVSRH